MSYLDFIKKPLPSGFATVNEAEQFRNQAKSVKDYFTLRVRRAEQFRKILQVERDKKRVRLAEIAERYSIEKIYLETIAKGDDIVQINDVINTLDNLRKEYYTLQHELLIVQ